jgi:hypothetical protein
MRTAPQRRLHFSPGYTVFRSRLLPDHLERQTETEIGLSPFFSCRTHSTSRFGLVFQDQQISWIGSQELGNVLATCLIHRDPSPEDDRRRAQGGYPTKEGNKPWVGRPSQESRLAGRHEFRRFNLSSVIGRVKDSHYVPFAR